MAIIKSINKEQGGSHEPAPQPVGWFHTQHAIASLLSGQAGRTRSRCWTSCLQLPCPHKWPGLPCSTIPARPEVRKRQLANTWPYAMKPTQLAQLRAEGRQRGARGAGEYDEAWQLACRLPSSGRRRPPAWHLHMNTQAKAHKRLHPACPTHVMCTNMKPMPSTMKPTEPWKAENTAERAGRDRVGK